MRRWMTTKLTVSLFHNICKSNYYTVHLKFMHVNYNPINLRGKN